MPLPSFLQRKPEAPPRRGRPAAEEPGANPVEAARTRARRRLIGAVVLLAVGVVVFPLVFETQPRPVAVNVPIEVPARKDPAVAAVAPKAQRPAPAPAPVAPEAPVEAAPAVSPAPASAPAPAAQVASKPAAAPTPAPAAVAASKPAPKPAAVAKAEDSERAKSLLEGKPTAATQPPAADKDARFVVQAGAYTDATALREAREKIERLGLKTYTQVVETDAGRRTRVRIGPFASRDEAERAAAKIKGAALPAAVLTL